MDTLSIKAKCGRCGGTGVDDNVKDVNGVIVPQSCTSCIGTGYVESLTIDVTSIMDCLTIIKRRTKKILDHFSIADT